MAVLKYVFSHYKSQQLITRVNLAIKLEYSENLDDVVYTQKLNNL